jgi:hypothetical protein
VRSVDQIDRVVVDVVAAVHRRPGAGLGGRDEKNQKRYEGKNRKDARIELTHENHLLRW